MKKTESFILLIWIPKFFSQALFHLNQRREDLNQFEKEKF